MRVSRARFSRGNIFERRTSIRTKTIAYLLLLLLEVTTLCHINYRVVLFSLSKCLSSLDCWQKLVCIDCRLLFERNSSGGQWARVRSIIYVRFTPRITTLVSPGTICERSQDIIAILRLLDI